MEEIITQVLSYLSGYPKFVLGWGIFASLVTLASIIVKMTPTKKDDNVVAKLLWIISLNKVSK